MCPISVGWLPGQGQRGAWKEGRGGDWESLSLSIVGSGILGIARPICSLTCSNSPQNMPLRHFTLLVVLSVLSILSLQMKNAVNNVCVSCCRGLDLLPWARTIYDSVWQCRWKKKRKKVQVNGYFSIGLQLHIRAQSHSMFSWLELALSHGQPIILFFLGVNNLYFILLALALGTREQGDNCSC